MKSFEDFTSSLTEEDWAFISGADEDQSYQIDNLLSPEGFSEFMLLMSNRNTRFTIRLLETYHNWLQNNLEH